MRLRRSAFAQIEREAIFNYVEAGCPQVTVDERTEEQVEKLANDNLLPQLKMPVLIVWGAEDRIMPLHQGERMH